MQRELQQPSLKQKIQRVRQIGLEVAYQGCIGVMIAIPVAVIAFLIVYFVMLLMTPYDPHQTSYPNLQIKQTDPNAFLAIYAHKSKKQLICSQLNYTDYAVNSQTLNFDAIGFTYAQFCNFNHEEFPDMDLNSPIDIRISNLPLQIVDYVKVCLHRQDAYTGQACQKYRPYYNILVFSEIRLGQISYFTLQFRVRTQVYHKTAFLPVVHFDEKINFISAFIHTYYILITFFLSCGMAGVLGLAACLCSIAANLEIPEQREIRVKKPVQSKKERPADQFLKQQQQRWVMQEQLQKKHSELVKFNQEQQKTMLNSQEEFSKLEKSPTLKNESVSQGSGLFEPDVGQEEHYHAKQQKKPKMQ